LALGDNSSRVERVEFVGQPTSAHAAVIQHIIVHQAGCVDHLNDFCKPPLTLSYVAAGAKGTATEEHSTGVRTLQA
jgi:hypothetical protein